MVKLLLILMTMSGALADIFTPSEPPLLIDSSPAAPIVTLDVAD